MNVFITGVSKGFGAALANEMAAHGHTIFGISRSGLAPLGWSKDFKGRFWKGDVCSKDMVSAIVSELMAAGSFPDMLVFNAALMNEDLINGRFDAKVSEHVFRVNCLSPLIWIEEFLPKFLERKSGVFIAVSSLVSYRPLSKGLHNAGYVASKSALSSVFDFFRLRYMGTGVKFLTFHFGRMGKAASGVPCVTYEKAADFMRRKLENHKNRTVFDYPCISALIYRFNRILPDRFWSNFIKGN